MFEKSNQLRKRAQKVIPGGAHTYSKGDDQFPQLSPGFIQRGLGSVVWDVDGNEFLDWGMGLRSVCLGHAYEPVLEVVRNTLSRGSNFTRPSALETELAEQLVDMIPAAEMAKFSKNGSDVTTAAVRLARAYTGNDLVLRCLDNPFFSADDWFIGDTPMNAGIPDATKSLTKHFPYNDIDALRMLLEQHKGKVACVIMEIAAISEPVSGYLEAVRKLTLEHGVVLIFDEIITGLRWHQNGAQHYYGITPDLATFGKAMANGFALAALVGKREIMELGGLNHDKSRVFLLSTTNGAETHALAAAKKTASILADGKIIEKNWNIGQQLFDGFNSLAEAHGISEFASMQGPKISPYYIFVNKNNQVDLALRTLFLQETIRNGVLIPYISISASHREAEVDRTLESIDKAFGVVAKAINSGSTDGLLEGAIVKPVFRKFN